MKRQTIIVLLCAGLLAGGFSAEAAEKTTPPKKAVAEKVVPRAKAAVKPAPRKPAEKAKKETPQQKPVGAAVIGAPSKEAAGAKRPPRPVREVEDEMDENERSGNTKWFSYRQPNAFPCIFTERYVPRFVDQVQRSNAELSKLHVDTKEGLKALERYRKAMLTAAVANDRVNQGRYTGKREDIATRVCVQAAIARGQLYVRLSDHQRNLLDEIEGRTYQAPIVTHKPGFDRRSENERPLNPEEQPIRRRK